MIKRYLIPLLMIFLVTACGNSEFDTLSTQHSEMGTQVSFARSTATVESDRLLATIEAVQTQVRFAEFQNQSLQSTLVERGFSQEDIDAVSPLEATIRPPTATPPPTSAVLQPTPPPVTPPQVTEEVATITPTHPASAALANAVTARSVRDDDCADEITGTFTTDDEAIYVVATAYNIAANTTLTSRWQYQGEEVVRFDFVPDFNIDGACIWFFIEPADAPFNPGTWSVVLDINGSPAIPPLTFVIQPSAS